MPHLAAFLSVGISAVHRDTKMLGGKFLPPRRFKISDLVKRKVIPQVHPADDYASAGILPGANFLRMLLRLKTNGE